MSQPYRSIAELNAQKAKLVKIGVKFDNRAEPTSGLATAVSNASWKP
jgi:hypothetical protein